MTSEPDVSVDFMDMTNAGRLWVRRVDFRPGRTVSVGTYVVAGDEGADPRVARVVDIDDAGNVELHILPGAVESHADLLAPA